MSFVPRLPRERKVGSAHAPPARQPGFHDRRLHLRRHLVLDRELLDHLGVLDLHVETLLVPVDQLLDRARQVLVGRDHGDQGADVQAALNHQVAADQIEQERRHL